MDKSQNFKPFTLLGSQLKSLRQDSSESLDEVSGAIEIDSATLERYENGVDRPSEDILILLINHFAVHDNKAVGLWQLAGYDSHSRLADDFVASPPPASITVMMTLDSRIIYTDSAFVGVDKNGVVFDFMQSSPKGQTVPVSRVGMSYAQARDFMAVLSLALDQASHLSQPKRLSAPRQTENKKPDFPA